MHLLTRAGCTILFEFATEDPEMLRRLDWSEVPVIRPPVELPYPLEIHYVASDTIPITWTEHRTPLKKRFQDESEIATVLASVHTTPSSSIEDLLDEHPHMLMHSADRYIMIHLGRHPKDGGCQGLRHHHGK